MNKLPNDTRVIVNDPYSNKEFEVTVLVHVPGYNSASVIVDGDTDYYTIRRFSDRFVRVVDSPAL